MRDRRFASHASMRRCRRTPTEAMLAAAVLAALAATSPAQRQFDELHRSGLPADAEATRSIAVGDVDGDGDTDIAFGTSGQTRLYVNDGYGVYDDATAGRMPVSTDTTAAVAFGDVDGDGDLDLVLGNVLARNRLYVNDGSGTFADASASALPADFDATRSVVLGDVDGDGDLDLLTGNFQFGNWTYRYGRQNRLYLNDGTGAFVDATSVRLPAAFDVTNALALGDIDGDGDLDIVGGNEGQDRLYLNLQRQLDAPHPPRIGRPFTFDAYARYGPPTTVEVALPFLSAARASFPLPPLGTLGLDPTRMRALPPIVVGRPAGVGSVSMTVPGSARLVGIPIFAQALHVTQPVSARLTNVTVDTVGR